MRRTHSRRSAGRSIKPSAGQVSFFDDEEDIAALAAPPSHPALDAARAWARTATPAPPPGPVRWQVPGTPAAHRGQAAIAAANVAALYTLRAVQAASRPATAAEQATLAGWTGWGATPEVFETRDGRQPVWAAKTAAELATLLNETELAAARRNTLNAHYTDPDIARAMWDAAKRAGFTGGTVLEPGCGNGLFIGTAPEGAAVTGVELDPVTAAIAALLYPDAIIRAESFADTKLGEDSFDLIVGNVPFGDFSIPGRDAMYPSLGQFSIHNHFILKALSLLRPGGLMITITSRYTLDAERDDRARHLMARYADLVGAVRLPENSHKAAAGTKVVMDILVLRRREQDAQPDGIPWPDARRHYLSGEPVIYSDVFAKGGGGTVLGKFAITSTGHGPDLTVTPDKGDLGHHAAAALGQIADDAKAAGLGWIPSGHARPVSVAAPAGADEGHITARFGGTFTIVTDGRELPLAVPARHTTEVKALTELRDTVKALLAAELATADDTAEIAALRARLNTQYDTAYRSFGALGRFSLRRTGRYTGTCEVCGWQFKARTRDLLMTAIDAAEPVAVCPECQQATTMDESQAQVRPKAHLIMAADPAYPILLALETFDPVAQKAAKAPIFTGRVIGPRPFPGQADSPGDALAISVDQHGRADLPTIAALLGGITADEARARLGELVYEIPPGEEGPDTGVPGTLIPAPEYLSGLVRLKLAIASAAAADDPHFERNVAALTQVRPRELGPGEIKARLGAAWIPADDVQRFLQELLEDPYLQVDHPGGPVWGVKPGQSGGLLSVSRWGTKRRPAYDLAQDLLEQRKIEVRDTVRLPGNREITVLNPDETVAAQEKAGEIAVRFADWIWEDPARRDRLVKYYNDTFNGIVLRSYDGSRLTLPGLSLPAGFKLHAHQVTAIARGIAEPATLLAHEVGAGKTLEMICIVMELRRLGLIRKAAVVVPNHMLEQFGREWLQHYPAARVLLAGTDDLAGDKRRRFAARCATGDWDAVIMTRSSFKKLPMSSDFQIDYRQAEIDKIAAWIEKSKETGGGMTVKRLEATKMRLEDRLADIMDHATDPGLLFEHTGCDLLVIDEAHGYKNLLTVSAISDAAINPGSQQATDLHMKLTWLRDRGQRRTAIFATATPIANSITEAHVMCRYLRPDLLAAAGVLEFDVWAATFGEVIYKIELAPEGGSSFRLKARFANFANVPELLKMFHIFGDVKMADDLDLQVPLIAERPSDGQRTAEIVAAEPSPELEDYVKDLGDRADLIRQGNPREYPAVDDDGQEYVKYDNMLWVSTHGRLAALDMRLVGQEQTTPGKIASAAAVIAGIARDNPGKLQIVFCDMGTPRAGWNAYDDLAARLAGNERGGEEVNAKQAITALELMDAGVPRDRIRFMHNAKTDRDKAQLFAACRSGHVSVIIGSTEKMGVGVNIQPLAIALHHIDAPWRPCDITQRDGRAIRQGNLQPEVHMFRYVTARSFDAYMWQTLERKARFIAQFMRGKLDVREIEDFGDSTLSYEEIKAIATDQPLLLEQAKVKTELAKLERQERAWHKNQDYLAWTVKQQESRLARLRDDLEDLGIALQRRQPTEGDQFTMTVDGTEYAKRADAAHATGELLRAEANAELASARSQAAVSAARDNIPVGYLGGFTVLAAVTCYRNKSGWLDTEVTMRFADVPGTTIDVSKSTAQLTDGKAAMIPQRLEYRLGRLGEAIAETTRDITAAESEIERGYADLGGTFAHTELLEATRERAARINDELTDMAHAGEKAKAESDIAAATARASVPAEAAA